MKYFLLLIPMFLLACNQNNEELKGPEYLKYRTYKSVLLKKIAGVDSVDLSVEYAKKTKYFFIKSSSNTILYKLYVPDSQEVDQDYIAKSMKNVKFLSERELSNYYTYDGLRVEFFQNGEQVAKQVEPF